MGNLMEIARVEEWQLGCMAQLRFMWGEKGVPEGEKHDFLAWQGRRRRLINEITKRLHDKMTYEKPDEQPLRYAYSAFALLAMLVSKQFTGYLMVLLRNDWSDWSYFDERHWDAYQWHLKQEWVWQGYWESHLWEDLAIMRRAWEIMCRWQYAEPVREIEDWEKRIWCEETWRLPRTLTPEEAKKGRPDSAMRRHVAFDRIQLTIDPYTPVEVAVKKMRLLLEQKQAEYLQIIREDCEHERQQGLMDELDIEEEVLQWRRSFDFARSFEGNKRIRGGETTFSLWLRSLRVYDAALNGGTWKDIVRQHWWNERKDKSASVYINRDKVRAEKLIDAAWNCIPLAAVKV